MAYEALLVEKQGQVDWVTLNRPETYNTLNQTMTDELQHYFGELYTDHATRIVVLKGAGQGFCGGLDLKEAAGRNEPGERRSVAEGLRGQRRIAEIVIRMRRCPQPIISLIHGGAAGGGFALALASDIRIAGKSAKMNAAFIRIGLSACDIGVSYFLPRLVGVSVASELMMTGRFIRADRALATGLVSEVVEDDQLEAAAKPYVEEMLQTTPLGLRLTKECLNMNVDASSLEAAVAMEDRNQILCAQSSDMREGIAAFFEKRPAHYTDT